MSSCLEIPAWKLSIRVPLGIKATGQNGDRIVTERYPPLSDLVSDHLRKMFALDARDEAQALLFQITDMGPGPMNSRRSDRCRIAALKLSDGDIARLRNAADLYSIDPRDLLMQAGFGSDLDAHDKWRPKSA